MKKVYVLGSGNYRSIFLYHPRFELTTFLDKADLVVFTGGTDINPELYNEVRSPYTSLSDNQRDSQERDIFSECVAQKIPMVGICRGAQFLCAMNGGKLVQHVMGHADATGHTMHTKDGTMQVTSSHHQMMQPSGEYELLGWAEGVGNGHLSNSLSRNEDKLLIEPEVVYWPGTSCLGHQPHPEWMKESSEYQKYFFSTIKDYLRV